MGEVLVPSSALWGAQTQRSMSNFQIGDASERMPLEIIYALAALKHAAASANERAGALDAPRAQHIRQAAAEVRGILRECTLHAGRGSGSRRRWPCPLQ